MKKGKFVTLLVSGVAAVGLVASLGLAGCSSGSASTSASASSSAASASASASTSTQATQIQIFAANSLEKALPEVQKLYTDKHPDVTFADTQFKASGDLVEQLKGGASADLLITASKGTMDTAEENKLIDSATRANMFVNDLVVVRAQGSDVSINSIEDVAKVDGKIAIGDAATVPAGKYANQALASVDLYSNAEGTDGDYADSIKDKVNLADKVGTAASWVSSGDCAVGFVYSSDIYRYDGIEVDYTTPSDSHKAINYPGAVTAGSKNATVAADFLNFCMTDPDAQQIFANYGFQLA